MAIKADPAWPMRRLLDETVEIMVRGYGYARPASGRAEDFFRLQTSEGADIFYLDDPVQAWATPGATLGIVRNEWASSLPDFSLPQESSHTHYRPSSTQPPLLGLRNDPQSRLTSFAQPIATNHHPPRGQQPLPHLSSALGQIAPTISYSQQSRHYSASSSAVAAATRPPASTPNVEGQQPTSTQPWSHSASSEQTRLPAHPSPPVPRNNGGLSGQPRPSSAASARAHPDASSVRASVSPGSPMPAPVPAPSHHGIQTTPGASGSPAGVSGTAAQQTPEGLTKLLLGCIKRSTQEDDCPSGRADGWVWATHAERRFLERSGESMADTLTRATSAGRVEADGEGSELRLRIVGFKPPGGDSAGHREPATPVVKKPGPRGRIVPSRAETAPLASRTSVSPLVSSALQSSVLTPPSPTRKQSPNVAGRAPSLAAFPPLPAPNDGSSPVHQKTDPNLTVETLTEVLSAATSAAGGDDSPGWVNASEAAAIFLEKTGLDISVALPAAEAAGLIERKGGDPDAPMRAAPFAVDL